MHFKILNRLKWSKYRLSSKLGFLYYQATNITMKKITGSQKSILDRLIFPETFFTIQEETKLQRGEIRDDLMQLLHLGMIKASSSSEPTNYSKTYFYDLDQVEASFFQATPRGLKALKQVLK